MSLGGIRGHNPEAIVIKFGNGEICLEFAAGIKPLRVRDDATLTVNLIG
jgi:hypothetical protein